MVAESDIRAAALPALRHRIILNFEGQAEGVLVDELVKNTIDTTPRA